MGIDLDSPDLWMPLTSAPSIGLNRGVWSRHNTWLRLVARLKPGSQRARVASEATAALLRADQTAGIGGPPEEHRSIALSGISLFGDQQDRNSPISVWMVGVTALVLLIACANIANLLLVRASSREREMSLRLSFGASRTQLVNLLLSESLLLAFVGGGFALILATWTLKLFAMVNIPSTSGLISWTVVLFTAGLSLLTVAFFGSVPAMRASNVSMADALKVGGHQGSLSRSRLRDGLVVLQLALSLTLLTGTGLLLRSLRNVNAVDPGFDLDHLLGVTISLGSAGYGGPEALELAGRALANVRKLPGVQNAAYGRMQPFLSVLDSIC
jgi:hypothetical protein